MQVTAEKRWRRRALFPVASVALLTACAFSCAGEKMETTMTESILNVVPEKLKEAQAKITYLGEQGKPIATVVFSATGYKPALVDFLKAQHAAAPYANDTLPYTQYFSVTPQEFANILQALKPTLTDPAVSSGADFLSFSVTRRENASLEGHEFKIGAKEGQKFYQSLIKHLKPDNKAGHEALEKQFGNIYPR